MNSSAYQSTLESNVRLNVKLKFGWIWVIKQGHDPKHRSKSTADCLKKTIVKVLQWSSQSPQADWCGANLSGLCFPYFTSKPARSFFYLRQNVCVRSLVSLVLIKVLNSNYSAVAKMLIVLFIYLFSLYLAFHCQHQFKIQAIYLTVICLLGKISNPKWWFVEFVTIFSSLIFIFSQIIFWRGEDIELIYDKSLEKLAVSILISLFIPFPGYQLPPCWGLST